MSAPLLSAELDAAYRAEAAIYMQALRLAEQWFSGSPEAGEPVLARITELLAEVQGIEDRLTLVKTQWRYRGCNPSGALADTLSEVADLIRKLQAQLDRVRQQTQQHKDELAPELDDVIRSQQMRRAYGDASYGESPPGEFRRGSTLFGGAGDGR